MKKRILSILLTLCMVACSAITPLTTYAEPGSIGIRLRRIRRTAHTRHNSRRPDGQRTKATRTVQRRGSPLPSPRGMSRYIYSYRNAEGQAAQDHTKVYEQAGHFGDEHCRMYTECTTSVSCGRQCRLCCRNSLRSARHGQKRSRYLCRPLRHG